MSLKKSTKDRIKHYILEKIEIGDTSIAQKTAENFNVSLTTVYRYLNELCTEEIIKKSGRKYVLSEIENIKTYDTSTRLEEDRIFTEIIDPIIKNLPDNVYKICNYCSTKIMIDDNGIGIFEKIKEFYGYETLDDAVNELFKGKLTTDSENHSGEGIFFTSRMIEHFGVSSDGKLFTHNTHYNLIQDISSVPELNVWKDRKGTTVAMIMPNNSKVDIKEVFDMYSDVDNGFIKTHIPLKSIFTDGYPVSRSQAKRLSARFESFEEIILDFDGIDDIGQGFAHELFVVFKRKHPHVNLNVTNENQDVRKMIAHVNAGN